MLVESLHGSTTCSGRHQLIAKLVGIGSGSTVPYVVDRIVQQGVEANKDRLFFPTGEPSH